MDLPVLLKGESKLRTLAVTFLVILLNSFGNLSLTWGMRNLPQAVSVNPLDYLRAMLSPFVALGIALLILWLLTRMALMSWADLSFVLPVTASGYILSVVLANLFLHEAVTPQQWVGTVLIMSGASLAGSAPARTVLQ